MPESFHDCSLAKTLKVIGSKWTIAILYSLLDGKKRFAELQKQLDISPRTLSLRLQQMEKDRIIAKKVFPEIPPHVEYSLTVKGRSLSEIINTMNKWGERVRV